MPYHYDQLSSILSGGITLLREKFIEKRKKSMIKISKEYAMRLNKEYGVNFGENGISRTHGHHKNYFLCESEDNLRKLLDFAHNDEARAILDKIDAKKRRYNKRNITR